MESITIRSKHETESATFVKLLLQWHTDLLANKLVDDQGFPITMSKKLETKFTVQNLRVISSMFAGITQHQSKSSLCASIARKLLDGEMPKPDLKKGRSANFSVNDWIRLLHAMLQQDETIIHSFAKMKKGDEDNFRIWSFWDSVTELFNDQTYTFTVLEPHNVMASLNPNKHTPYPRYSKYLREKFRLFRNAFSEAFFCTDMSNDEFDCERVITNFYPYSTMTSDVIRYFLALCTHHDINPQLFVKEKSDSSNGRAKRKADELMIGDSVVLGKRIIQEPMPDWRKQQMEWMKQEFEWKRQEFAWRRQEMKWKREEHIWMKEEMERRRHEYIFEKQKLEMLTKEFEWKKADRERKLEPS